MTSDDDLDAPLGLNQPRKRRFRIPRAVPQVIAGMLGAALVGFVGWIALVDDPLGGEPVAVVAADARGPDQTAKEGAPAPRNVVPGSNEPPKEQAEQKSAAGERTITIIDGMSGKRQQVVIGGEQPALSTKLVETSRHGAIPRIATDGTKASDFYAKPIKAIAAGAPKIAIVVVGLGVGGTNTADAIAKLPGAVTFAFAPYGTDLERSVERARASGHEILLQVPMEPQDYPDNDPGPQTLLTSLPAEQNIDRLHWFMSRFGGYVGLTNYMGARFTATEPALGPILRETGRRGLLYFDDGSSARSLAMQTSGAGNVPFARADLQLDAAPSAQAIDAALRKLEAIARERGSAVGVVSALPVSVERVAQWVKAAGSRGIVLVPISMLAQRPRSS